MKDSIEPTMSKRGRPKQTQGQVEGIKNSIINVTRTVFGLYGSQGTTVARIIKVANISRPTFYKYFDSAATPLNLVVEAANLNLVQAVVENVAGESELLQIFQAITDTYLDWGKEEIDIVSSIRQELLNPDSVVAIHRGNTIHSLYQLVKSQLGKKNKPIPDKIIIETIMMAAENIGYYVLLNPQQDNIETYRSSIVKLAIALMGEKEDWMLAAHNKSLFS